jgi:hypothetical protein
MPAPDAPPVLHPDLWADLDSLTPERCLLLAILGQALKDATARRIAPETQAEARAFLASAACAELCEWLGAGQSAS